MSSIIEKIKLSIVLTLGLILISFVNPAVSAASVKANAAEENSAKQKAVLVTGASTGIGRYLTEALAKKGYHVYAGARKDKDLKALNAIENVQALRLDVNKWEDINAAVEVVKKEGRGLYALVNNAGVAITAPLIEVEEEDLNFQFNVNIYGPYRVTKAFAPMIIESKGRISTIGSIAGTLSSPFMGPYSMSKHAMEAFSDVLAKEMQKFDVQVSVVEPGNYDSAIGKSLVKRLKAKDKKFENSLYKENYEKILAGDGSRSKYKPPHEVVDAVIHALFSDKPKHRYMVVPNAEEAGWTITQSMRKMIQQNHDQAYSYSREDLIKIMDSMLEEVKK